MTKTMSRTLLIIAILTLTPCMSQAASRLWKNNNATRSFQGEFIKRDANSITIKMVPSGKQVVLKPEQLHATDLQWLKENHPLDSEKPALSGPTAAAGSFYDTLSFGDDKATVIKKLKASKCFHTDLDETYFARVGMNGTFHTTKGNEFFGMTASLYYDWNEQGGLKNLSLYGHETPTAKAEALLVPKWQEMVTNINKYYGPAKSNTAKPQYAGLGDSEITFSHAWPLKTGGSLLLGVGKQDGNYVIIARFTNEQH